MATLLVHEWLAPVGGSENVFEELSRVIPEAHRICLWNDAPRRFRNVEETWIAKTPLKKSKALAFPFLPSAWSRIDLTAVDKVVASTHASSHVLASRAAERGIPAFAYVHTPPRYVWAPDFDARGQSLPAKVGRRYFRDRDRRLTSAEFSAAANSEFIRERIRHAWGIDSEVIYPPVEVESIQSVSSWRAKVKSDDELAKLDALPKSFVLGASRLVEYKRLDAVMRVGELLGIPVVIAGSGPFESELRKLADATSVPVHFFGYASTEALHALYSAADLFVFMAVEDFGIMPVEAMAHGTPVLVNEVGGARESVERIGGGSAVNWGSSDLEIRQRAESALNASSEGMKREAIGFGVNRFRKECQEWIGVQ